MYIHSTSGTVIIVTPNVIQNHIAREHTSPFSSMYNSSSNSFAVNSTSPPLSRRLCVYGIDSQSSILKELFSMFSFRVSGYELLHVPSTLWH